MHYAHIIVLVSYCSCVHAFLSLLLFTLYTVEVAIEDVSEGSTQNHQSLLSSDKSCGHSCEAESQALCCLCTVEQGEVHATTEGDIIRMLSNCSLCQRSAQLMYSSVIIIECFLYFSLSLSPCWWGEIGTLWVIYYSLILVFILYRRCDNQIQQTHSYSNKIHSHPQTSRTSPQTAAPATGAGEAAPQRQRGGKNCVIM